MTVTQSRIRAWTLVAILWAPFILAWLAHPWLATATGTLCPYRLLTSYPCAFCGLTRALSCAIHGEFAAARVLHPYWWMSAVILVGAGMVAAADAVLGGDRLPRWTRRLFPSPWVFLGLIAVLTVFRGLVSR